MSQKSQKRAGKTSQNEPNNCEKTTFSCKICDYVTSKKSNYNRHLNSAKHLKKKVPKVPKTSKTSRKTSQIEKSQTIKIYTCAVCLDDFTSKSSFYRHKKTCSTLTKIMAENAKLKQELKNNELNHLKDMNEVLRKQNKHLKEIGNTGKTTNNIHNMTNTQNTNNISINMYLNEYCKNAMNLTDFVDKIKIQLKDINMESNYVDCVSNILIKNLKILDVTERPIHCSDKKRLQFYIKDGETWEKDINKLDQSIDNIHNKQYNLLHEFDEKNPNQDEETFIQRQKIASIVHEPCLNNKETINEAIKRKMCESIDVKNIIEKID